MINEVWVYTFVLWVQITNRVMVLLIQSSRARGQTVRNHVVLHLTHEYFFSVENTGGERGRALRGVENVGKVRWASGTGGCDDGDTHGIRNETHELVVKTVSLPVFVDAVEQNFPSAERLHGDRELVSAN